MLKLEEEVLRDAGCPTPRDSAIQIAHKRAGTIVQYPTADELKRFLEETSIVGSLRRDASSGNVRRLGEVHGRDIRHVAKTLAKRTGEGLAALRQRSAAQAPSTSSGSSSPAGTRWRPRNSMGCARLLDARQLRRCVAA